jgi:hypothetical protein
LAINTFWHARWDIEQRKADDETSAGTNAVLVLPTEPSAPALHEGYYETFMERFDPASQPRLFSLHGLFGFNDLTIGGHVGYTNPNGAEVRVRRIDIIQSRYLQSPVRFGSGEVHMVIKQTHGRENVGSRWKIGQ